MRYFHYHDGNRVIRIKAARQPSQSTKPKLGTWVVRELNNGKWQMPSFPEILWSTLSKLEFLGSVKINDPA